MSQKQKQWAAIAVMISLFAMIAFVTNLCSPMAVIVKNQFSASNFMAQVGNYGNFIAYLVMGYPAGLLIKRYGYKATALLALVVGIVGIFVQWVSGWDSVQSFAVYLVGAFIAGFCMCMLNTVVNPMLNLLGGGGKQGNQLIQIGGSFNSAAAVAIYIIMGALIGDATKARISDATPALFIAMGIFAIAFIVILFTKIEEPESQKEAHRDLVEEEHGKKKSRYSAFSFRHFNLGILAIFLYMGLEVGVPTYMILYLSSETPELKTQKQAVLTQYEAGEISLDMATWQYYALEREIAVDEQALAEADADQQALAEIRGKIENGVYTSVDTAKQATGLGLAASMAGLIAAVYWLLMFVGRLLGGIVGGKVSSRAMITFVSGASIVLLLLGMYLPSSVTVNLPGISWAPVEIVWAEVPIGILFFVLIGLCTSVMWGGIFNMATEGLGKYTSIASGAFMTMVFGCAVLVALEGWIADLTMNYISSYWVMTICAAYILFYALIGSRNVNRDIPTT